MRTKSTPKTPLSIEERKRLLAMPTYSYHEVMKLCQVKKSKAFQIMKICKEKLNGKVIFEEHKVKRNSVLAYCGTSIEEETHLIRQLEMKSKGDTP